MLAPRPKARGETKAQGPKTREAKRNALAPDTENQKRVLTRSRCDPRADLVDLGHVDRLPLARDTTARHRSFEPFTELGHNAHGRKLHHGPINRRKDCGSYGILPNRYKSFECKLAAQYRTDRSQSIELFDAH